MVNQIQHYKATSLISVPSSTPSVQINRWLKNKSGRCFSRFHCVTFGHVTIWHTLWKCVGEDSSLAIIDHILYRPLDSAYWWARNNERRISHFWPQIYLLLFSSSSSNMTTNIHCQTMWKSSDWDIDCLYNFPWGICDV